MKSFWKIHTQHFMIEFWKAHHSYMLTYFDFLKRASSFNYCWYISVKIIYYLVIKKKNLMISSVKCIIIGLDDQGQFIVIFFSKSRCRKCSQSISNLSHSLLPYYWKMSDNYNLKWHSSWRVIYFHIIMVWKIGLWHVW